MISVDRRDGSSPHALTLRRLGAATQVEELPFGDFAFSTESGGPGDRPAVIGVELKRLSDLLQCIGDSRYSGHQLPGMLELYDFSYLIVEGMWRPSESGSLEVYRHGQWRLVSHGRRTYTYKEVDSFLTTLAVKSREFHGGPVMVRRTSTEYETAYSIYNLYRWWTGKSWSQHQSLTGLHIATDPRLEQLNSDSRMLKRKRDRPEHFMKTVAIQQPKVGYGKLDEIVERFGSARIMANATEAEWAAVPGIGPKIAKLIVDAWTRKVDSSSNRRR